MSEKNNVNKEAEKEKADAFDIDNFGNMGKIIKDTLEEIVKQAQRGS